jgi:2-haloacid dehalogenase
MSNAIKAYAFDAYGTLFDVHAAIGRHRPAAGQDADAFSALWRQKHLEYSWTRTLMGRYVDFWTLAQQALDFCFEHYPNVPRSLRQPLLDAYFKLDAFPDAAPLMMRLRQAGLRTAIFTNGTAAMAEAAGRSAGLERHVEVIVSVDDISSYKTAPEAYGLLHRRLELRRGEIALVSSNRWDVAGAVAWGMPAIMVNRGEVPEEYADLPPSRTVKSLSEVF